FEPFLRIERDQEQMDAVKVLVYPFHDAAKFTAASKTIDPTVLNNETPQPKGREDKGNDKNADDAVPILHDDRRESRKPCRKPALSGLSLAGACQPFRINQR